MEIHAFVQKLVDAYNEHDVSAFDELLTDDCIIMRNGVEAQGLDGVKGVVSKLFRALPDVHYVIDDVLVSGDKLALRWHGRGTSQGDYLGVPTLNGPLSTEGITVYQLRDDRIAHIWVSANVVGDARSAKPFLREPEVNA